MGLFNAPAAFYSLINHIRIDFIDNFKVVNIVYFLFRRS